MPPVLGPFLSPLQKRSVTSSGSLQGDDVPTPHPFCSGSSHPGTGGGEVASEALACRDFSSNILPGASAEPDLGGLEPRQDF